VSADLSHVWAEATIEIHRDTFDRLYWTLIEMTMPNIPMTLFIENMEKMRHWMDLETGIP